MGLQLRRGSDTERQAVTFDSGEPVWTTDTTKLYIGDGVTAGGIEVGGSSYTLPIATTSTLGGVKVDGTTITINTATGVISSVSTGSVSYSTGTFTNLTVSSIANINEIILPENGRIYLNNKPAQANAWFIQHSTGTEGFTIGNNYGFNSNNNWNSINIGWYSNGQSTESVFLGNQAGMSNGGSHNYSVMIGYRAGKGLSGSSNTVIGNLITAQGSDSETFSNTLLLGAGGDQRLRVNTSTFYINKQSILSATTQTGSTITLHKNILPDVDQTLSLGSDSQRFLKGTFHNLRVHNDLDVKFLYSSEDNELQVASNQWFGVSSTGGIRAHSDLEGYIGWPTQRMAESHINTGTFYSVVQTDKISAQTGSTTTVVNHLVPETDSAIDLGRADKQFRSLYVSSSTIFIDGNEVGVSNGNLTVNGNVVATPNQTLNTSSNVEFAGLTVNGDIVANKLTIQYTTVTTTMVETDDVIQTTNATQAGAGVGAIVATAGGISATNGYFSATTNATNSTTGALRVLGGINAGGDIWVEGGDIRGPRVRLEEQTSGFVKKYIDVNTNQIDLVGTTKINGSLETAGNISANSTTTNLNLYGGSYTAGVPAGVGAKITLKRASDNGDIVFSPNQTDVMTLTNTSLNISVPVVINNTATIGYATFGPNNGAVSPINVIADTENMLYFNDNQGGSLIFRQRLSPTSYRNFTINRSGSLVMDTGAFIANGGTNSGGMVISSYYNTSTNVSGNVTINSYANEGIVTVGADGVKLQTYGDAKTIDFDYVNDDGTTTLATVSSSTYTVNIPLSATTATITYTNVGTAAQLRSQSSNFPFGESTATIMTIDTAVYSSARLQICVGATLGLDSHTERLTMDILTNGTDVLNAQSGVLSTTSTGICSYSAVLSGTDILVKAELIDPINFLGNELNVLAELVANPMV